MRVMFRSVAALALLALVGCDANPDGPAVEDKDKAGTSNVLKEGTPATPKEGQKATRAQAPPLRQAD